MQSLSSITTSIEKAVDDRKTELELKSMGHGINHKMQISDYKIALIFKGIVIQKDEDFNN